MIDDVRLEDEAEWIHRMGGVVFRIIRDFPELEPVAADTITTDHVTAQHVSEQPLPDHLIDGTYHNTSGEPPAAAIVKAALLLFQDSQQLLTNPARV